MRTYVLITLLTALMPICRAEKQAQSGSISIPSELGLGFGNIILVEGSHINLQSQAKGLDTERFSVTKINGKIIDDPIHIKVEMLNNAAKHEFLTLSEGNQNATFILIGFETLSVTGIPEGVNQTLDTIEQTTKWNLSSYFVVVRSSGIPVNWPKERNGMKMNQIRYYTYENPINTTSKIVE